MRRGSKKNRLLDYWAGIPILNAAAALRPRRKRPQEPPKKIGVLCSPALGDTLLFSAAMQDLRSGFPEATIVHCCMPQNRGAANIIPGADRLVVLDLTRPFESLKLLRPEHFDLFVDYSSWQRLTAFLTLHADAAYTIGFSTPAMFRGCAYDFTVQHCKDLHEIDNFRQLTQAVGVPATHAPALAPLDGIDLAQVWPYGFERPLVLMHLWPSGQKSWLREWPEDRWLQLGTALATKIPGVVFGVTGTTADLPRMLPLLARMGSAGLTAHPVLASFAQLAELTQRARLVVSVNTGVMHLAAVAGAPTVSINGPNSNKRWGPVGPHAIGVEAPGEGCGYLHLGFDSHGKPTDCMERTTVEQVLAACCNLLDQNEQKADDVLCS